MKTEKISKLTVILGIILLVVSYTMPLSILGNILGEDNLKDIRGIAMAFIIPLIGIIGSVFSIYKKQWLFLILNILLIVSFFIYLILVFLVFRS